MNMLVLDNDKRLRLVLKTRTLLLHRSESSKAFLLLETYSREKLVDKVLVIYL